MVITLLISPLTQLTLKTSMILVLLSNADRASDLHLLDIAYMKFDPTSVRFIVVGLSNTRRSGLPREVFYHRLDSNVKLCPVRTLELYLKAT